MLPHLAASRNTKRGQVAAIIRSAVVQSRIILEGCPKGNSGTRAFSRSQWRKQDSLTNCCREWARGNFKSETEKRQKWQQLILCLPTSGNCQVVSSLRDLRGQDQVFVLPTFLLPRGDNPRLN